MPGSPDASPVPDPGRATPVPPACGNQRPDISGLNDVDGLAIAPDGTMYFARAALADAWVGRMRPDGSSPEPQWLRVPASGERLWGLALDGNRNRLYVASGATGAIYRINLNAEPPELAPLIEGLTTPADLAIDQDGSVLVAERGDRKVHRVSAGGERSEVTPDPLSDGGTVGALALGPQGALFVGLFDAPVVRIELSRGVEQTRAPYGESVGRANGLVFDARGRLYVGTAGPNGARVVRIDDSGTEPVEIETGPHFSSMAFGRGALDCRDLYISVLGGALRRVETDAPGAPLP
jgi:sugar lactone lactonase YvrE